jgi:2'-5' RNA ligase
MPDVRTFIAVDLPTGVKLQIGDIISPLRPLCRSIRWVRADGLHLTLKFLGQIPEERLPEIFTSLETALSEQPSFHFQLAGMGGFPNLRRPRVLWIGLQAGGEQLQGLSRRVEDALIPRGFPPEKRPFSPHLTIGRVRSPRGIQVVLEKLPRIEYASEPIAADAVKVMKSQLKPTGAEYSTLKVIDLRAPAEEDSGSPGSMESDKSIGTEEGQPSADPTP